MEWRLWLPLWLLLGGLLPAAPLKVASLSTITSDIARNVGGSDIVLEPIIKPGIDPHDFQPTPSDVKTITQADLVLLTGKGLEGYLTKIEESAGPGKFIDTGKAFPSLKLEEDGKQIEDPHWWHSIGNVKKATAVIRDAFIAKDPAHQSTYEKNAAAYLASLDRLQQWANETIAALPREKRKLVTSHDAFQYFARDFGFKIYAVEGVSSDDEPSSKNVVALIGIIRDQGVKAVFFENIENPKVIGEITKETGAKVGGELYADGLGDPDAPTYEAMVKHNISTIVNALK
jgi:zinc/manganese transport system substrate-binding protein